MTSTANGPGQEPTEAVPGTEAPTEMLPHQEGGGGAGSGPPADGADDGGSWFARHVAWTALIVVVVGLGVGVLVGWLVWGGNDDSDAQAESAAEIAALESQNHDLAQQTQSQKDEIAQLEKEKAETQQKVEAAASDIAAQVEDLGNLVGQNADQAAQDATQKGWSVTRVSVTDQPGAAVGTVVGQSPVAGTPMVRGSALVLEVAAEAPTTTTSTDASTTTTSG